MVTFDDIMRIEDHLQEKMVFVSGFDNSRLAHRDSYMTIVKFDTLDKVIKDNPFTKAEWTETIEYWLTNENVGVACKVAAHHIQDGLGLDQ